MIGFRFSLLMIATLLFGLATLTSATTRNDDASAAADHRITEQLSTQLYKNPAIASNDISVQTHAGVVYLHGTVDTNVQRAEIEAQARAIAGVRKVVNSIELRNDVR